MGILNKYKRWNPTLNLRTDKIWDFVLSQDYTPTVPLNSKMTEKCLAAYIDTMMGDCYTDSGLCSMDTYAWANAVNDGAELKDIGFTGIDNGLISYKKDRISNLDFYNIFFNSLINIESGDTRLFVNKVDGNTGVYSYPMEHCKDDKWEYYALRGGFFQGFYKLFGFDYQVLPQYIEDTWVVETVLRPKGYIQDDNTLNMTHKNTDGIFFYMGTRAENKFAQIYNCDLSDYASRNAESQEFCETFIQDGYFGVDESQIENDMCCCGCGEESAENAVKEESPKSFNEGRMSMLAAFLAPIYMIEESNCCPDGKCGTSSSKSDCGCKTEKDCTNYFGDNYIVGNCDIKALPYRLDPYYTDDYKVGNQDNGSYLTDNEDYFLQDVIITGVTVEDSEGISATNRGYFEIATDNKFLIFDRTKLGFTTDTWNDGDTMIITGKKRPNTNLFLLMNRTRSGYTVSSLDKYYEDNEDEYDVISSIKGNAFALRVKNDGSVGYRYLVKDCDSNTGYSIKEEYSFPNMVKFDEWNTITAKFQILNGSTDNCGIPFGERKMKIYIYVNGYLKFISHELPEFNFKELNDRYTKQEGVPFNLSIGGGTQGLCDSVWLDYYKPFDKILPIEENFAGTFIGDIRSFKFYTCDLEYNEIKNNALMEKNK